MVRSRHQEIGIAAVAARLPDRALILLDASLRVIKRIRELTHPQPTGQYLVHGVLELLMLGGLSDDFALGDEFLVFDPGVLVVLEVEQLLGLIEDRVREGDEGKEE